MEQNNSTRVGVVGAGTMGAGIALVALTAGYSVSLCDVQEQVLERAKAYIEKHLLRFVTKGRMSKQESMACMERLHIATAMSPALDEAKLVIEAVPENLDLKRKVLGQIDQTCPADAILATNTSSISITVLAAKLARPERVIGLHFFNPAPVMKLVEIVIGEDTAQDVLEQTAQFAGTLGKQVIVCKDTPGFVVNRIARNFYGESLKIVGEGAADIHLVDELVERVAGFRMGPFALMDLIGIDVNFDVTQSVYHAYHQEVRFRPHLLQEKKVLSGHLGRKTGRGFYSYQADGTMIKSSSNRKLTGEPAAAELERDAQERLGRGLWNQIAAPVVIGDTLLAIRLQEKIQTTYHTSDSGIVFDHPPRSATPDEAVERLAAIRSYLVEKQPEVVLVSTAGSEEFHRELLAAIEDAVAKDTVILSSLAGPSASQQASWLLHPERLRGYSIVLPNEGAAEWSCPVQALPTRCLKASGDLVRQSDVAVSELATGVLAALGYHPMEVQDGPGGISMRILLMILNEAYEVMHEGTAGAADVDLGMKLGTNYPFGPVEWTEAIGAVSVWYTLQSVLAETSDPRYRVSRGLQCKVWEVL
ncbi:3-hydroxyacyl-CoA dehydrogenase NAD-binding domain-containing protein [Alicyclobacillus ferrooxydans]|uniref:3-hydroxyacyl-CoA dehydrogenase NAD-binding domain-containing protein n=1 Tax=Alicyclobacillus ferrooxydans TaxID=471514 RepID=UPI0009F8F342|nr:3-hydroxyacyl-CoA dehydrogenase NAD-binding domain-containing protein [Alicyclobacillus ferrooxydans]